jgi:hypothetical protein
VQSWSGRPPLCHHADVKKVDVKSAAKQVPAKQVSKKGGASSKKARATSARKKVVATPTRKIGPRADYGAPVDRFFAKQPPQLRAILDELRKLVDEAAPDASSSLKWGMPFYTVGGNVICALAGFKGHVNLILSGPPGTFADPDGLLKGNGKTGRHLKVRSLDALPGTAVRGWLRIAAERARKQK